MTDMHAIEASLSYNKYSTGVTNNRSSVTSLMFEVSSSEVLAAASCLLFQISSPRLLTDRSSRISVVQRGTCYPTYLLY